MKTLYDFVKRLVADLKLAHLAPGMQKAFELKIEAMVDEQIGNALLSTLTDADWRAVEQYREAHPGASDSEVIQALFKGNPEVQGAIEETIMSTYQEMMLKREALEAELGNDLKVVV